MQPYGYQEESIAHLTGLLSRSGAAIDGSDPGVGKTLVGVETMRRLGEPATLVVCPKAVVPGWQRTAAAQGTELDVLNYEMLRTGRTSYGEWRPPDPMRRLPEHFRWHPGIKFLIFDEAHRCKGYQTKNSELLKAARRQNIRTLAMSATLADNPLEMDALGYALRLHDGDAQQPTLRNPHPRHFLDWARDYGVSGSPPTFYGGPDDLLRLHAVLYPHHGVRVRIPDLGDLFPETQITAELCEVEDSEGVYEQMARELEALKKVTDRYFCDDYMIAERQQAELLKVPAFVSLAQDAVAQGLSVAIFVNFRRTLEAIGERLGTVCKIDGSQTGKRGAELREWHRSQFQSDRERVILCISEAGGVGLDLHDITGKHPRLALISPGWDAKNLKQVLGRVHRAGGRSKSLQRLLFAANTVEESVWTCVSRKLDNLSALNDGDLFPNIFRDTR